MEITRTAPMEIIKVYARTAPMEITNGNKSIRTHGTNGNNQWK